MKHPFNFHGSGLSPKTWEDIENKKEELPKLRPLVVAMKIHDNIVQNDKVLVNDLSNNVQLR